MRFVTLRHPDGSARVAIRQGDDYICYERDLTMLDLLEQGRLSDPPASRVEASQVTLLAPLRPRKVMAVGRNYAAHAAELANDVPTSPMIFTKYSSSIIGTGEAITWRSSHSQQVDWEAELAVIIGRKARDVSEADAYDYVFGYTTANDVSARDLQASEDQWSRAKSMDTFLPLGPFVVTHDEIGDPHNLQVQSFVNDQPMQNGHTSDMIFRIPFLISFISQAVTLEPGDLILTGTPAGVGKGMKPPRFLGQGDEVRIVIEPIGTLVNSCTVLD